MTVVEVTRDLVHCRWFAGAEEKSSPFSPETSCMFPDVGCSASFFGDLVVSWCALGG